MDPLKVIQSPVSLTKKERRRAYRRKRNARLLNLLHLNVVPLRLNHSIFFHTPLLSLIVNRISLITPPLLLLKNEGLRISMILLILSWLLIPILTLLLILKK